MQITREQQLIILGLIFVILVGSGVTFYRKYYPSSAEKTVAELVPIKENNLSDTFSPPSRKIIVHLCGEVGQGGVYRVKEGTHLAELLSLAGGVTGNADIDTLNLASTLKDGDKITVPARQITTSNGVESGKKININTASLEQLKTISGIGPTTAQKIIDYRKTHGPFSKPEDLLKIPRFGKARLEQVKDNIYFY
jgi:competence protein ComEA